MHNIVRNRTYRLKGSGVGSQTVLNIKDKSLLTDIPRSMGGHDVGPQPVEMMLASLCGCEQVTAQFVARHMKPRVHINKIDFEVYGERDDAGAVSLPIDLESSQYPEAKLTRIWGRAVVYTDASQTELDFIAKQVKRRCPIANMVIASGCALEISFEKGEIGPEGIVHNNLS